MQRQSTYYQIVIPTLGLFLGCYFLISSAFAYQNTETPDTTAENFGKSAPVLNPVANVEINPYHLNSAFSEENGFSVAQLLEHIERMYVGRQFSSVASSFNLQNSNYGIAILSINAPNDITPLVSIGGSGNSFRYPISNPRYSDLARLFEPHQKISFRSNQNQTEYEVKIRFRLWDLRERNQITPFQEYRIDQTGGVSAFSVGIQEVTLKISSKNKETRPFWSEANEVLNQYNVKGRTILLKVEDMLKDQFGELKLRDKDNSSLGILLKNPNFPSITFFYRYNEHNTWTELHERSSVYLPLKGEIYISNANHNYDGMLLSFVFSGWDGDTRYQYYSTTDDSRAIDITFKKENLNN